MYSKLLMKFSASVRESDVIKFSQFFLKYNDFQASDLNTISDGYQIFVRSEFELPSLFDLGHLISAYSTRHCVQFARKKQTKTASSSTASL